MHRLLFFLAALFLYRGTSSAGQAEAVLTGKVRSVTDGDGVACENSWWTLTFKHRNRSVFASAG